MSSLPGVKISIQDGALGRLAQGSTNAFGLIRVADKLPNPTDETKTIDNPNLNKITTVTDPQTIVENFGENTVLGKALIRAFDLGATKVYAYAVKDTAQHAAAVDALLADTNLKEFIAVADPTEHAFWSTFASKLNKAAEKHNYTFGVVQARAQDSNKDTDFSDYVKNLIATDVKKNSKAIRGSLLDKRLQICAGNHSYIDTSGTEQTAPFFYSYIGALQNRLPHEGPDAFKYGALPGVVSVSPAFNDQQTLDLQNADYTVARQYYGVPGVYVNLARIAAGNKSDFDTVEKIRIINKVSRQVRRQQLTFVNANVVLDGSTEGLLQFKQHSELPLKAMINAGEVSGAEVIIPEGQDIIGTRTVKVIIRVKPLGKLSTIETTLS